jgi:hypothetical protein
LIEVLLERIAVAIKRQNELSEQRNKMLEITLEQSDRYYDFLKRCHEERVADMVEVFKDMERLKEETEATEAATG